MANVDAARLLVVDDDEAGRYRKARVLRRAGFEVFEAGNGTDALRWVREQPLDMLVLDTQLPDISGWEVCRRVKADGSESPIVLQVSATYVQESDTVKALEGGADGCLTEPIDPAVLLATVRALLRMRRAEAALRESLAREQSLRQAAESANRAKDDFLATLSHELRSPLGTILTWVTMLKEGRLDAQRSRQGLDAIERSTQLQVKLIGDLLDISSIISGKTRLEISSVDLAGTVHSALDAVRSTAEAKRLTITSRVDPGVPRVAGDAVRLLQIVQNLCSNAVKFTAEGGSITIAVRRQGDVVEIEVADTGKGIATSFLPHIFERFRQADASTTRSEGGLGLGLAIVRHLVELHHGSVAARSDGPGKGSSFVVWLPIATPAGPPRPALVRQERAAGEAPSLAGLRVLIVDDEHDARDAIATALAQRGATIQEAGSVDAALTALANSTPDLLVSDIAMPSQDGYALIRSIRSRAPKDGGTLPAVALTAYGRLSDREAIIAAGYDECLTKPIEVHELVAVLARLARR